MSTRVTDAAPKQELDWFLRHLVELVYGTENEIDLTLHVRGALVTGHLVSEHRYFEALESVVSTAKRKRSDADAAELEEYFQQFLAPYRTEDPRPPDYIHLRAARFVQPGASAIPTAGTWWRGRLSQIDGFSIGLLVTGPADCARDIFPVP